VVILIAQRVWLDLDVAVVCSVEYLYRHTGLSCFWLLLLLLLLLSYVPLVTAYSARAWPCSATINLHG
jgi:hypothetical protein